MHCCEIDLQTCFHILAINSTIGHERPNPVTEITMLTIHLITKKCKYKETSLGIFTWRKVVTTEYWTFSSQISIIIDHWSAHVTLVSKKLIAIQCQWETCEKKFNGIYMHIEKSCDVHVKGLLNTVTLYKKHYIHTYVFLPQNQSTSFAEQSATSIPNISKIGAFSSGSTKNSCVTL